MTGNVSEIFDFSIIRNVYFVSSGRAQCVGITRVLILRLSDFSLLIIDNAIVAIIYDIDSISDQ